jgi:aminopeptidase-like protein
MEEVNKMQNNLGKEMYSLAKRLFPICRSITGDGVRKTLQNLNEIVPIEITEVPSGTQVFDWEIPKEWNIRGGYIEDIVGKRIIDFADNNLHILGYSTPVDIIISREDLETHLYVDTNPDAIPYVTSYYTERWGFCLSQRQKELLTDEKYHVVIDSTLTDGFLTYGEIKINSQSNVKKPTVLISTYICHPSMANNEISGPCVSIFLANELAKRTDLKYEYRFVFNPETIGSITYISRNLEYFQQNITAGYVLSCVGDERAYSVVESRKANTLADRALKCVLSFVHPEYKTYSFLFRGSDERQYNAPNVNLPVCGFCRSKYGEYPEYHTSEDNLSLITPDGLQGSLDVMLQVVDLLERNAYYKTTVFCEPQLGKRGLYPTISKKGQYDEIKIISDLLAYADGTIDLIDICNITHHLPSVIIGKLTLLLQNNIIEEVT